MEKLLEANQSLQQQAAARQSKQMQSKASKSQ